MMQSHKNLFLELVGWLGYIWTQNKSKVNSHMKLFQSYSGIAQ